MNHAGDAAEQVVRMSLEGAEVALKITGVAAKKSGRSPLYHFERPEENKRQGPH